MNTKNVKPSGVKHEFLERSRDKDICHLCLMRRHHEDHLRTVDEPSKAKFLRARRERSLHRDFEKQLRYPRQGHTLLPRVLHPAFGSSPMEHERTKNGVTHSTAIDLTSTVWATNDERDVKVIAEAIVGRLSSRTLYGRFQHTLESAEIKVPEDCNFDMLPMSELLRSGLEKNKLTATSVQGMTVADLYQMERFGIRKILELLALLEYELDHPIPKEMKTGEILQ